MTTIEPRLTDAELDGALDRLMAPAPSETLDRRVRAMAPRPAVTPPRMQRFAAAAALVLAVAAALVLQAGVPHHHAVAGVYDPAGEIAAQDIDLVDPMAAQQPAESFSVAGLPLE